MGAASYIGRIGGLAVALGVGTAIITGQGVAYATPDGGSQESGGSQSGGSQSWRPNQDQHRHGNQRHRQRRGQEFRDLRNRRTPSSHRNDVGSVRATTIVRRLSDAADATAKRVADAIHDAGEQPTASRPRRREPAVGWIVITDRAGHQAHIGCRYRRHRERLRYRQRRGERSSSTRRRLSSNGWRLRAPRRDAPAIRRRPFPPRRRCGHRRASSPGRAHDERAPTTRLDAVRAPNLLAAVLGDVFNPFAGNSPNTPTPDTPLSWMLLGAARRQIGVDSITSQSLLAPADSITYAPESRWSTVS